jgi:hypothetical protein
MSVRLMVQQTGSRPNLILTSGAKSDTRRLIRLLAAAMFGGHNKPHTSHVFCRLTKTRRSNLNSELK